MSSAFPIQRGWRTRSRTRVGISAKRECEGNWAMGSKLGTRLIFVDGLPGSGKSTMAEYVAGELEQRGIPCRLLREREPDHPLNVGRDLHPSGSTTGAQMFAT